MQNTDIIMLSVVGTNGSTRNQKTVSGRFNGEGIALDDNGQPTNAPERLENLPNGTASLAPSFPQEQYAAAVAKGAAGADEVQKILVAHAEKVDAWKKSVGGGDEKLQIVKSVLAFLEKYHGFKQTDGNWFVIKPENLAVNQTQLADKRSLYNVTATAVFGA